MSARSKFFAAILVIFLSCRAFADDGLEYENWLVSVGDYGTLARSWRGEATLGNAEKQERLAALFLGPHAREAKARPYKGIHFLFRAAVSGRRESMLRLAGALEER